ncbi:hypothetical protein LGK95_13045 [Clostridium algoriphilum]|uniref:hypothetical protein n=1 Tax=Clostridium algoriphilum TaxID=198347 RepID=UPI001CF10EAB|nr:hypothetical protein [Clostridium algoriphilum]MCB2294436.1 hypothetical protein [Clostridium algoriphilum]
MYIEQPNNFNQIPISDSVPVFSESQITSMQRSGMYHNDPIKKTMAKQPVAKSTSPAPIPSTSGNNLNPEVSATTSIINNPLYTQGWLIAHIGKYIKIEFLIGSNMLIDREGILQEVGISYIIIKETGTNDLVLCDIYSIKFVRVFDDQTKKMCVAT